MASTIPERPLNCAVGGAAGALLGTMFAPDNGLIIAAATGVGAGLSDMLQPLALFPMGPMSNTTAAASSSNMPYSYKLALSVAAVMYLQQSMNTWGSLELSPTTALPLLRGGLSGALACIAMQYYGGY